MRVPLCTANTSESSRTIKARTCSIRFSRNRRTSTAGAPVLTTQRKRNVTDKKITRQPGRPKGAKNKTAITLIVIPTACPKCASTNRSRFTQTQTQQREGIMRGQRYSRIVRRSCHCINCGQKPVEQHYEFDPETAAD